MTSPCLKLVSGASIPQLGIGSFLASEEEIKTAIVKALEVGYRHIDTAYMYLNEGAIGDALEECIQKGILKREDVFITTKLPPQGHRPDLVRRLLEISLKKLKVDYVDLYLIHTPLTFKHRSDEEIFPVEDGHGIFDTSIDLVATWKAMEECVDAGLVRDIGVSNFNSQQVQRIYDNARIKPSNNQVECHVYFQQDKLFDFCKKIGVTITAYAPFGSPSWVKKTNKADTAELPSILENPVLAEIGKKYNKTCAQVALRWTIQRGIIVIPKSSSPNRIPQNFDVFDFELSEDDMAKIKMLDAGQRFFMSDMVKGTLEHPNYPYNIEY